MDYGARLRTGIRTHNLLARVFGRTSVGSRLALTYRVMLNFLHRKYLSDPTEDVRVATDNLLAGFLKEIKDIATVQKHYEEKAKQREAEKREQQARGNDEKLPDITMSHTERAVFLPDGEALCDSSPKEEVSPETEQIRDTGGMFTQRL